MKEEQHRFFDTFPCLPVCVCIGVCIYGCTFVCICRCIYICTKLLLLHHCLPSHILLLLAGNPSLHHCLQHHHRHPNIMTMSVFWLLVSCISLLNTSTKYYFKGWSKLKVLAKGIFSAILTAWSLIQEEPTGFGSKEIQNWYLKVTGGEN